MSFRLIIELLIIIVNIFLRNTYVIIFIKVRNIFLRSTPNDLEILINS